jgi:LysM repeat protein
VKAGETLFSIAQHLGTDVNTLRRLNNLTGDTIAAGQVLKVPAGAAAEAPTATPVPGQQVERAPVEHIVQRGEYLALIADRYGVSTNAIMKANNLRNPNVIYPGQKLIIPAPGAPVPTATPASAEGGAASGKVHIVQRGETLQSIALKYGVTVKELAAANGIRNPNFIYVGQKLVIP